MNSSADGGRNVVGDGDQLEQIPLSYASAIYESPAALPARQHCRETETKKLTFESLQTLDGAVETACAVFFFFPSFFFSSIIKRSA